MKFLKEQKIVIIGDSVTDAGRVKPVGEGLFDPLGQGYVRVINQLLHTVYPELHLHIVNMGVGGNTSRHLLERFDSDAINLQPDWVSIMIGINDVWRQFDSPTMPNEAVLIDEYEENLVKIITKAQAQNISIILMTPYYIESNVNDQMRMTMDKYGAVCKNLAEKYSLLFVDTQAIFSKLLEINHSAFLSWDRVHPNSIGHAAIAKGFLDCIGFDWQH